MKRSYFDYTPEGLATVSEADLVELLEVVSRELDAHTNASGFDLGDAETVNLAIAALHYDCALLHDALAQRRSL